MVLTPVPVQLQGFVDRNWEFFAFEVGVEMAYSYAPILNNKKNIHYIFKPIEVTCVHRLFY